MVFSTHHPLSPLLSPSLSSSSSSSPMPSSSYSKQSSPSASSGTKISPSLLFIIVILAVVFFISGLLHLVIRVFMKQRTSSSVSHSNRYPETSGSAAFQRQLRQLFHLHDSGLDQSYIDALPVFLYEEIAGPKEPFDCAVCLCEFSNKDKLRLLPLCSHAFHIDCIDTWLLSNSTCPLCRGTLFAPGFSIENPVFEFDGWREEEGFSENISVQNERVFSVRLGKFRSTNEEEMVGETSSSDLAARRCFSMGSFQYVVADSELQVALCPKNGEKGNAGGVKGQNGDSSIDGDTDGKKINSGSKGESFSVSKIWLWSKKGSKFPSSSNTHNMLSSSNASLPWTERT